VNAAPTLAQLTVAGVSGSLGACARGHVVQEYKPGHENAIIHDQLTEESNVPDQAERLVLVTRMIVQWTEAGAAGDRGGHVPRLVA